MCYSLTVTCKRKIFYIIVAEFPVENSTKSCCHICIIIFSVTWLQFPFHKRMYDCISSPLPEKLFNRLLLIKCTVRNYILQKHEHEKTLTTAVRKVINHAAAIWTHHKIIIHLCSEIVLYIVYPDSVNLWHRSSLLSIKSA